MVQGSTNAVASGRRHIIRRPRLTKLLDETSARCILLVAPAGYGKTTLAREWLSQGGRAAAWYQGSPASRDVAALAVGIAEAAATAIGGAGARMRERLRATKAPELEPDVLAELLAEDLLGWPDEAWLVVDDYHFAAAAGSAEKFIESLYKSAGINLLVTSRRRPAWATARRLLYGELVELGSPTLAMDQQEATEVLVQAGANQAPGLVALAEGWPAVIGLAAFAEDIALPEGDLPTALYDFFAEELFSSLEEPLRWNLSCLSIAPKLSPWLVRIVLGSEAEVSLEELTRTGFLTDSVSLEIHPLLREFLNSKLAAFRPRPVIAVASRVANELIDASEWDDAFSVITRFSLDELLPVLIDRSLDVLLREGRLSTLQRWVEEAGHLAGATGSLAAAEIAFRQGHTRRAELLASSASIHLNPDLRSRAHYRAGQSAYYLDKREAALSHFGRARHTAKTVRDKQDAIWGELVTTVQLEEDHASELLRELEAASDGSPEQHLRIAIAHYAVECLEGDVKRSLPYFDSATVLLQDTRDPMVRTSFLNFYSRALALQGYYSRALDISRRELRDADTYRLLFVRPNGLCSKAIAELGLGRFANAKRLASAARAEAEAQGDVHNMMDAGAILSRVCLVLRDFEAAENAVDGRQLRTLPAPGMGGEYLACRALAAALQDKIDEALGLVQRVLKMTRHCEALPLAGYAEAVTALRSGRPSAALVVQAFESSWMRGNLDSFIVASRAEPELTAVLSRTRYSMKVQEVLDRSNEPSDVGHRQQRLSPREREVFALLAAGLPNKAIAQRLFISDATTKVHVRHILKKLGARSRVEAALLFAEQKD